MTKKKDPAAVALARKRAQKLSPERRRQIARQAIAARWTKAKTSPRKKPK